MRIISPRNIGAAAGVIVGILFLVLRWWQVVILIGIILAGYLAGTYFETHEDTNDRVRGFFKRLLRR
jgi:uncharacterized membrane protein